MARKHASARRTAPAAPSAPHWRQLLLLLTIVPMAVGVVLFVAAWADWVFLGSQMGQTVAGALIALVGFAAANALQAHWLLAAGWAGLGIGVWLLVGHSDVPWMFWAGAVAGAGALVCLGLEFVRRYRALSEGRPR